VIATGGDRLDEAALEVWLEHASRMAIVSDRAYPAQPRFDPHPLTDGDLRHRPVLRLLDRLPLIRFGCALDEGGGDTTPLLVAGVDMLGPAPGADVGDRWDLLCQRVHPDDFERFQSGRASGRLRDVRISDGSDYRLFRLSDEVVGEDGQQLWHGVLVERPAPGIARQLTTIASHLSTLASHLPGALYRCEIEDETTRCTFASPTVAGVFGVTAETLMENPAKVLDHVHSADRGWLVEAWLAAASSRQLFDREFRIIRTDGREERWVRAVAQMTGRGRGRVVADGIAVDITRRMRSQEELERRNRELLTLCRISEIALTSPTVASGLDEIAGEIALHLAFPSTVIAVFDESAQELGLQEATVKIHVRAVLKALGVRNRTQAAMIANAVDRQPPAAARRER
jgi:PAS domain S-box-containing protein